MRKTFGAASWRNDGIGAQGWEASAADRGASTERTVRIAFADPDAQRLRTSVLKYQKMSRAI
jgi:hypothetical protein